MATILQLDKLAMGSLMETNMTTKNDLTTVSGVLAALGEGAIEALEFVYNACYDGYTLETAQARIAALHAELERLK